MSHWQTICALTVVALAVTSSPGQKSQAPKSSAASHAGEVVRITLPDYSPEPLKGPNVEVYEKNCLLCHTARYVITQPGFDRSTWEKEVKKMIDAYGASVPEADQQKIVDYLVAVRGAPEKK